MSGLQLLKAACGKGLRVLIVQDYGGTLPLAEHLQEVPKKYDKVYDLSARVFCCFTGTE